MTSRRTDDVFGHLGLTRSGFVAWMLVSEDCPVQRISGDAHADWTSEFQHSVKRLDRNFDLTHATCIFT